MVISDIIYRRSVQQETFLFRVRDPQQRQLESTSIADLALLIVGFEEEHERVNLKSEGSSVETENGLQRPLYWFELDLLQGHLQAYRERREFYWH